MSSLSEKLKEKAKQADFASCRITGPDAITQAAARLQEYLALGRHGDMDWLQATAKRRSDPQVLWPEAKSIIMLSMSYASNLDPMDRLKAKNRGNISVYALGRDYHDVIKGKLKNLAGWLAKEAEADVKVFVDTAPLMEKPLAQAAGLGWQGKHSNLVSRELGSWFFLGAILTTADLPRDESEIDHCGTCRNCLDICPTKAFPAPYQLDARRCISYLTIEHEGHIAREFREAMGNRIYGCDDCLAVCPWNKFAVEAREAKLKARDELVTPELVELLKLDDAAFRKLFSGSPIKRTGRDRFIRNVLIAAGNALQTPPLLAGEGDHAQRGGRGRSVCSTSLVEQAAPPPPRSAVPLPQACLGEEFGNLLPQIERLLSDHSPLVRAVAVWALARLDTERFLHFRNKCLEQEADEHVRQEWLTAA